MRYILFICLPGVLSAQFVLNGVTSNNTTATIRYNSGTSAACTLSVIDVATGAIANDVNAALGGDFTGANSDTRFASSNLGPNRAFTVGQRGRGIAADGKGYVRALIPLTQYRGQFTCNGFAAPVFTFTTANVAVGNMHNDGVAVDRANPGQYALDTINWVGPQTIIDPLTGIAAQRAIPLADVASSSQSFITAFAGSGWATPSPTGTNTLTGAGSVSNALFLRADGFSISGGPTYTRSTGSTFDWIKVAYTGVSSSAGGQSVVSCITVNGINCATTAQTTTAITTSSAAYLVGTGALMDCLQNSGTCPVSSVDVSTVTGTAGYVSGTGVLTKTAGFPFSLKWVAGSLITVGSTVCTVGSVQNELQITLSSCPAVTTGSYSFTANNFGILTWCTGSCVIGPTTYTYGTAPMQELNPQGAPTYSTGPIVTVGGVQGQYSFVGSELLFYPLSGAPSIDKGSVVYSGGLGPGGVFGCGSDKPYQFDPEIAGAFYCAIEYFGNAVHIVRFQLTNDTGQAGNSGVTLPTCPQSGLCITYTTMTGDIYTEIVAFNANCANFPFTPGSSMEGITGIGGIYVGAFVSTQQDYMGCMAAWTLGTDIPRTPEGTDAGSVAIIAAIPSWSQPCATWCNIHTQFGASTGAPGWISWGANDKGPTSETYIATMTSSGQLGTSLISCPTNPFGISGTTCSAITLTGDPTNISAGATLQHVQVGDIMKVGTIGVNLEFVRVLEVVNPPTSTSLVVQRGYYGGTVFNHPVTTVNMECGGVVAIALQNLDTASQPLWDFKDDPFGLNTAYNTIVPATYSTGAHGNVGLAYQAYTVQAGGGNQPNATLCPTVAGYCDPVLPGDYGSAFLTQAQATIAISISPQFAGISPAIGSPNQVDTHPGPVPPGTTWIMDGRPMEGNAIGQNTNACSSTNPFTNTTGFLWKCAAANVIPSLHRKLVTTMAYVGRSALVDVSGPGSVIGGTSADNFKFCNADIAGECVSGSTAGDIFFNAPFVSFPYCFNPNPGDPAVQTDDTNMICIGDLGAYAGNVTQVGVATNDITGSTGRALGGAHNIWNQQDTFWTSNNIPSGRASTNYARWADQLASAITINFLPPYPAPDAVNRATFVPVVVTMNPPPGVTGETVTFWYPELGGCTTRQDNCVASSATINQAAPFQFASETITPLACVANPDGCPIAIPAISQHNVWWQPVYWAGGVKIFTGPVQQSMAP